MCVCVCVCVQEPGREPGDIIIVLDEKEHSIYTRRGADLMMKMVSECLPATTCIHILHTCMYVHVCIV